MHRGRAVQLDPIETILKAPRTNPLKPNYDTLLSIFAFNFNLHRYTAAGSTAAMRSAGGHPMHYASRQGLTLVHFSAQRKRFIGIGGAFGVRVGGV